MYEQSPQTALQTESGQHSQQDAPRSGEALTVRRLFTQPGVHPFDAVEWEIRDARIGHGDRIAFEQTGVDRADLILDPLG